MEQVKTDSLYITLIVKAPNQKITDTKFEVNSKWTILQLKEHLELFYPGSPDKKKQRIIYSGKLLNDTSLLHQVFPQTEESAPLAHTVHLVCPNSPSATPSLSSASIQSLNPSLSSTSPPGTTPSVPRLSNDLNGISSPSSSTSTQQSSLVTQYGLTESELTQLWSEYHAYLQSYYCQQFWMAWQCGALSPWMLGSAGSVTDSINGGLTSSTQARGHPPNQAPGPAAPGQQRPQVPDAAQNAGGGFGRFLGGMMEGEAEQDQPRDALDYVYLAVRLGLLVFIVHYYSSFDKVMVAVFLFTLLFLLQRYLRPRMPEAIPAPAPPPRPANNNEAPSGVPPPADGAPEPQQMDRGQDQAGENAEALAPVAVAAPFNPIPAQLVDALRMALETVVAFFTSLIPERPPPINLN